jgi:oligosaccharide repeat unit polymerase
MGVFMCVSIILWYNYQKGYQYLWSPLSLLAIIFAYYCLLGPYEAVSSGKTYDRLLNMRPFYVSALWGAFVLITSCVIGFHLNNRVVRIRPVSVPAFNPETLREYGQKVWFAGFILFTISTGGRVANLINPLDAEGVEAVGGSFNNYLGLSLNFLIPGVALLFMYSLRTGRRYLLFIILFLVTVGIFTSLGFRYRLVLLIGAMSIIYYLNAKRRPNVILALVGFLIFVTLMGVINESRTYGHGLDTNRLGSSNQTYFESGLNESRIFQTSGAVIDLTPGKIAHVGFTPIINTLLFPIPKGLYQEKNSAEYLFNALDTIYGGAVSKGSAFMAYGEYYLAFGWLGIVAGGFLIGWFSKRLWIWYLSDEQDPLRITVYSVTVVYLYVIISRGYLPQVTMLFFFSVFPIYIVKWLIVRRFAVVRKRIQPRHESHTYHQQPR